MKQVPASGMKPLAAASARSRVTNGRSLLPGVDGRTLWARRMRDIMALHVSDLGGPDGCSEAEKSIVRRVATLTIEMEKLERRFASASPEHISHPDLDMYSRLSNTLRRLLDMTGLQRRSRDITPTIEEYIDMEAAE